MCATSLFFIYGLLVIQVFAQPTDIENVVSKPVDVGYSSIKQPQNTGKRTTTKSGNAPPALSEMETFQSYQNTPFQSLSNIHIESAADVDKLINEIEKAADSIYISEMANIQSWSQNEVLAPFQSQAEEGLTIARDRLKESAQKLRTKATEAIQNAQATMNPEEFSRYMKELQQVIEIELAPTRQYFMDAAEAITQVAKETVTKANANPSRGPTKSSKKSSNTQNAASQVNNIPTAAKAA